MRRKSRVIMIVSVVFVISVSVIGAWIHKGAQERKVEFGKYLEDKYPQVEFKIGSIKFDPLYQNIYARVTRVENDITFSIGYNWDTKETTDNYSQIARIDSADIETERVFKGTVVEKYVVKMFEDDLSWQNANGEHQTKRAYWLQMECESVKDEEELALIVEECIKAMIAKSYDVQTVYVQGSFKGKSFSVLLADRAYSMRQSDIAAYIEY